MIQVIEKQMGRILMFSNPLAYSSAYSGQSYHLCKTLLMMGHELFLIDCALPKNNQQLLFKVDQLKKMYEQQHPEFLDNFRERDDVMSKVTFVRYMYEIFPTELYVKDFNDIIKSLNIDYMLFFIDIWIIKTDDKVRFDCPAVCWLPIHFDPIEERTVQAAELFDYIVTLSFDGEKKLREIFPDKMMKRVPHIIEFEHFDLSKIDKPGVRREMGIPEDCWLLTMVMNNSESTNRKCFCANFDAFKRFHDKHPDSRLYIHSKMDGALDLQSLLDYYDITPEMVIISDRNKMGKGGYKFDWMVKLFKVTDCLLNATASEGYGCSPVESQAVGTPVVVTNTTAMPDNLYFGGIADVYDFHFCYQNSSYWAIPDVRSIVKCIEKLYNLSPEEWKKQSRYGMKMVRENYHRMVLYEGWKEVFGTSRQPNKNLIKTT